MESQAYANPLSLRLASIAADPNYSVPHDHTKVPPSTRADKDIDAGTQLTYDITKECMALFGQFLRQPENPLTGFISFLEWQFFPWPVDLDAFAHESARLDIKLKLEPDFPHLVMPPLEILQKDLRLLIELESRSLILHPNPLSHGRGNTNSNDGPPWLLSDAAEDAMKGIIGSVYRLRHLITGIMSPLRDHLILEENIVDFAKQLPRDGFEDKARLILEHKFPKAEERLITKLVESIAVRRHRILYQRQHYKEMRANRVDGQDEGCKQQASTFLAVESPWMDESRYPIPPKAEGLSMSAICQIWFQELQVVGNEDPMWWEKHIEGDMEYYVCLSEDCDESLCYFRSFNSWLDEMNREHVYDCPGLESEWRCKVSENCSISFDNEDSLRKHLADNHSTDLEPTGLQLAVEKSKFLQPRDSNICRFCEKSINDSEPIIQQPKTENDGSHKEVHQRPDGQQSVVGALQNDENNEKRSVTNANSSIRPNKMDLRMAAYIADHLKSVSLLCLWGLDLKREERQEEDSGADMFGIS
ncbi:hypothetical protein N5P37_008722 [Trichoderma harzianum]|uniref:C2H2-type domain-containing protein n=1 Tax=Trichoderma harzianum CBS 226.95 TaxID=983964 RepID=A0A2T4A780_TRIHA|nr:hypothetical protein M431DRAFT_557509 [Trichoderma harzianum CBS 226.95]KAK0758325.1 hypothetical protein N5P37_008722 [Trichoderma harzianum]PTB52935.1 hypothetical protein M431DRAFT_557509 [Trichoderma harzianum CBS 226.95]